MTSSFQLKGSLFTLSILQLQNNQLEELDLQLAEKIKLAPKFFQNAPVVIDCQKLNLGQYPIDFKELAALLRRHRLVPVGVRGVGESTLAEAAGFAILSDTTAMVSKNKPVEAMEVVTPAPERRSSRLITQPIRSGQQIYAEGGDLIVLSSVSPGAELLADGHIHVYGTLRGRALAGINGDEKARIFCQKLEAELVSIAGQYKIFEEMEVPFSAGMMQLYLDNGQLIIGPL